MINSNLKFLSLKKQEKGKPEPACPRFLFLLFSYTFESISNTSGCITERFTLFI